MRIHYLAPKILQTLVWIPARLAFVLFARIKISGKENLNGLPRGVIFASNHASEMDPTIIPAVLTPFSRLFPMFYVARSRDFYTTSGWRQKIYGGLFFALWGAYPAYSGRHNYKEALKHHIEILSAGHSIHIFPEGEKMKGGEVSNTAHGGVAYLAWKTGAPIVPVAIGGTFRTTVSGFFSCKKRYAISFGRPLYSKDLFKDPNREPSIDDHKKAAELVMTRVRELHKKYHNHTFV